MNSFRIVLFLICISCSKSNTIDETGINENTECKWIISENELKGSIYNSFNLMNNPQFKNVSEIVDLNENDNVALISFENEVRVYPYAYTNYSEVVNDVFKGNNLAVSYCPITKSGICFDRNFNGKTHEIIASGYLYKDNMVPSDVDQTFFLSQMLMKTIKNPNAGKELNYYNLIETKWKTVLENFPNAKVFYLDRDNVARTSQLNKEYLINNDIIYGINNKKIDETIELYPFSKFNNGTTIFKKIINNKSVLIIGNSNKMFITSYYSIDNLDFSVLDESNFPNILKDNEGGIWNIFGYAVEGSRKGQQLSSPKAYLAKDWAWKDFYMNLIYN
jgi:hypothetical protein